MGETSTPRWSLLGAALVLACSGGLGVPLSLNAQTVVDPSGRATMSDTANGVPMVNIEDPNAGGTSVYGDKGVYLSNTLTMTFFGGLSGFIGADVGGVADNTTNARNEVISGWATGLRGNWRNASFSMTYAKPMQTVERVPALPRIPESVLYATAGVRF